MIAFSIFVIVALAVVSLLWIVVRGRANPVTDWEALPQRIQPVDLEAFRNLTDPAEETWLRSQLSPNDYAAVRRERLAAAIDYLARTNGNAAVLIRLGQAAEHTADPALVAAGRELVATAMRTRWYTVQAMVRLKAAAVVPLAPGSIASLAEQYQALRDGVDRVSRLRSPVLAARMAAAM